MRCAIAQCNRCQDSPVVSRGLANCGGASVPSVRQQMSAARPHRVITTTVDRGSDPATWTWYGDTVRPARSEGLDWFHVNYCFALLACGILFGLFVGGYVGYMENATPHGGEPWSLTQPASSPASTQWADMIKHYRAASGEHVRSLTESETVSDPQALGAAASKTAEQSVSAAPGFGDVKKAVVVR